MKQKGKGHRHHIFVKERQWKLIDGVMTKYEVGCSEAIRRLLDELLDRRANDA